MSGAVVPIAGPRSSAQAVTAGGALTRTNKARIEAARGPARNRFISSLPGDESRALDLEARNGQRKLHPFACSARKVTSAAPFRTRSDGYRRRIVGIDLVISRHDGFLMPLLCQIGRGSS